MILEGIGTTLDGAGVLNVAPMGPDVSEGLGRFVLRPYRTSTTFRNLRDTGVGVLHVTDDVLLLARALVKRLDGIETPPAATTPGGTWIPTAPSKDSGGGALALSLPRASAAA